MVLELKLKKNKQELNLGGVEPDGGIKHNQVAREESRLEKVKIIKERNKN